MEPDVVNITKIKDGFFLGDEATAANLEVIIQFKITHMVNAAGSQIINAWESIGIKYLTLNWSETPNQNLFDPKDEIANRIVSFIDDSFKNGEGFLVHSVRGQNRACLVVLIYFVKKYRWTLKKAIEFLSNKKSDIDIPNYFLSQLNNFEARLGKLGLGPKSNSWFDLATGDIGDIDNEELLIRNTYLNGLVKPQINTSKPPEYNYKRSIKCLVWSDQTKERSLILNNNRKDLVLYNVKDIKPVTNHKKMKPKKSCLKSSTLVNENFIKNEDSNKMVRNNSSNNITEKLDNKENNPQYTHNKFNQENINKAASNIVSINSSKTASDQFLRNYENRQIPNISEVKYTPNNNQVPRESLNDRMNVRDYPRSYQPSTHSYLRENSIKKDKYSNYINRETNIKEKETRGGISSGNNDMNYEKFKSTNPSISSQPSINRPTRYSSKPYSQINQPSRPYSVEQRRDKKDDDAKIIISPQVQNIVNNNINNIYIQPPDVENFNRIVYTNYNKPGTPNTNPTNPGNLNSNYGIGSNLPKYSDLSDDNNYINNSNKLVKNSDNQRVLNNNYFQSIKDPSINFDYSLKMDNSKNFSNNNIYLANLAEVKSNQPSLSQTLNVQNQASKKMPIRPKSVIKFYF